MLHCRRSLFELRFLYGQVHLQSRLVSGVVSDQHHKATYYKGASMNTESRDPCRERVAAWMIEHGYATGHGDTLDDLLDELVAQDAEGIDETIA